MAERRMRLKRGKKGDTGIPVTSAPPALSFPESLSQEPSAFDEDMVDQIAETVGCAFLPDDIEEVVRHAIKLAMATTAMKQVLNPPPAPPRDPRPVTIDSINVSIESDVRNIYTLAAHRTDMVVGPSRVAVTVTGHGDPVSMLREAADTFHSDKTRIRTV